MAKERIYRTFSLISVIVLILNAFVLSRFEIFHGLVEPLEFVLKPIALTCIALWISKRIVLLSLFVFFIGLTIQGVLSFNAALLENNISLAESIQSYLSIIGLILMMIAIFSGTDKYWLLKKQSKIEIKVLFTVLVAIASSVASILVLGLF